MALDVVQLAPPSPPMLPPLTPDLEAIVENAVAMVLSCLLGVALACVACISLLRARRKQLQRMDDPQPSLSRPQTADDRLIARMVATGHAAAGRPVTEGIVLSDMSTTTSNSRAQVPQTAQPLHGNRLPAVVVGVPLNESTERTS